MCVCVYRLISVLSGRGGLENVSTSGDVYFLAGAPLGGDGQRPRLTRKAVKRRIGFVSQDEVLFANLTVEETLVFTAKLKTKYPRQHRRHHHSEKHEVIRSAKGDAEAVMALLGLSKVKSSLVGDPMQRGVSGGERKRVSIAIELLTNPAVIFLDEPTSGLDSTTALSLMKTLKNLARGNRSIIASIHQPSSRVFNMIDQLILLSSGKTVYNGCALDAFPYFEKLGMAIPRGVSFAEVLLDIANGASEDVNVDDAIRNFAKQHEAAEDKLKTTTTTTTTTTTSTTTTTTPRSVIEIPLEMCETSSEDSHDDLHRQQQQQQQQHPALKLPSHRCCSGTVRQMTSTLKALLTAPMRMCRGDQHGDGEGGPKWKVSWFAQFWILLHRSFRQRRFEVFDSITLVQFSMTGLITGVLWFQVAAEKPRTEASVTDIAGYVFFSLTFMTFTSIFASLFTFPSEKAVMFKERRAGMYRLSAYYLAKVVSDLPLTLFYPFLFISITYWMAGMKPTVSAFATYVGVAFVNVLCASSVGLNIGAYFMNLKKAQVACAIFTLLMMLTTGFLVADIPKWIDWIKYVSFIRYSYKIILHSQLGDTYYFCPDSTTNPSLMCPISDMSMALQTNPNSPVLRQALTLCGFMVLFRIIGYLVLLGKRA